MLFYPGCLHLSRWLLFCLQNVIIYVQRSSLPVNLGTLGIPSCVTSKQDAFNRIGFQQRPRNSRPSAMGEPIRFKCRVRKNAAYPSMIDARRWKWQVMAPRIGFFNNTASYVNQTLKMHARACVYIHWRRGPPQPATQLHVRTAIFELRDLPERTAPSLWLLQCRH